jgi:hypothetical protein
MRYENFKNRILNLPLIFSKDLISLDLLLNRNKNFKVNKQIVLNQIKRWQDKELLIKLKKGIYILNSRDRRIFPSRAFISNQLYVPSYISCEYALSFYGLIPERVIDLTSVTTKKTTRFVNKIGTFIYQHIKPSAFRGFKIITDEAGLSVFIALPEKAIVDFLYLNLKRIRDFKSDIFDISFRFQNMEILNTKKLVELALLFENSKLNKLINLLCKFIKRTK